MASRMHGPLVAAARVLGLAMAIVVITTLATGWLYWIRADVARWPGPMVRDVLPLDELPGHDSVPLVVCVVAFGVAAAGLGLVARALRLGRLAAGLSLAAGVGVWLLLVDAVCLFIVRQEPLREALRGAAGLQPIYLEAAIAGVSGALLGRSGRGERGNRVATLLAWMVAAGGLIDLISALFPHPGPALAVAEGLGPGIVVPAAHALLVPVGALLLVAARGLARRGRRAWQLSVVLLGLSAVLHLIRGPDYAATIVTGLIAVALVAWRQEFRFRGDPGVQPPALLRLAAMLALAVAYGLTAIWTHQAIAGLPFSFHDALLDTLRGLAGMRPLRNEYLPRSFSWWFPFSVLSIAAIGLIWAAEVWSRPWRQRFSPDAARRERAAQIVREWGCDTLAPFTLRTDKECFITGQTLIAYRVVRGIAVVSGDPVGPPAEAGPALDAFLAHIRARGWHIAVLGASDRLLQAYRDRGLHPMYQGSEAVIDVATFSLDGRYMRTVRQAVNRLARRGYRAEAVMAGDVSPELRTELTAIDRAWLRGELRKGFTMELDSLFSLGGSDAMFLIGRDEDCHVAGCLHLAVCPASRSLSLSSLPRRAATPNGFSAWLIVAAVSWARRNGYERVSLNFAPFADLLSAETVLSSAQRLERGVLMRLKRMLALQLDNLVRFNRQFSPGWQPRYVVVERRSDLPRVLLAAMAAEGYLPHADLVRGADWTSQGAQPETEPLADADELPGEPGRVRAGRADRGRTTRADAGRACCPPAVRHSTTGAALMLVAGLLLALLSTAALSSGFYVQHAASGGLPELTLRHPVASLSILFRSGRWVAGFVTGLAGWGLYIVALDLAPLSLVQAVSAGGVGVLALLAQLGGFRLGSRERLAVAASVAGLLLLGLSLPGGVAHTVRVSSPALPLAWIAGSAVIAAVAAVPVAAALRPGAGLAMAAGLLYAAGDVATKAAVGGVHPVYLFALLLPVCHGLAFVLLQLAFQRGTVLATAGVSSLLTNLMPIVAGFAVFGEQMPGGLAGALRVAGFTGAVVGAALLAGQGHYEEKSAHDGGACPPAHPKTAS